MAIVKNDPFPGTDYTQYSKWPQVTMPGGQIFYEVPGNSGYVFDPVASNATGRKVFRPNPKLSIEKQQEEEARIKKQQDQQAFLQSPAGQLLPVVAGTGGLIAAHEIMKPSPSILQDLHNGTALMSDNTIQAIGGQAPSIAGGTTSSLSNAAASGGLESPNLIGASRVPTEGAGFFDISSGGLLGEGAMPIGNYIPGIAGTLGMADVLMNKKHGTSGAAQGALSGAGIGFTVGGPVGAGIGALAGGTLGYFGNFGDEDRFKTEWKRKKDLVDKGILSADQLGPEPTKGRSKDELIAEEEQKAAQGLPSNVEFARTRDESVLTPTDIRGYSTILEKAHETGLSVDDLSQRALSAGAVREHHGTIDVDWGKVNLSKPTQAQAAAQAAMVPVRSKTLSPGIGLDGRPISYR